MALHGFRRSQALSPMPQTRSMCGNAFPQQSQPEPRCALAFGIGSCSARRAGDNPAEPVSLSVHFQGCSLLGVVRWNRLTLLPSERGPRLVLEFVGLVGVTLRHLSGTSLSQSRFSESQGAIE